MFSKKKLVPVQHLVASSDFNKKASLSFARDKGPAAYCAVMFMLQDRIIDAMSLATSMAASKDHGYVAHAAGQLAALTELFDDIEAARSEAHKL